MTDRTIFTHHSAKLVKTAGGRRVVAEYERLLPFLPEGAWVQTWEPDPEDDSGEIETSYLVRRTVLVLDQKTGDVTLDVNLTDP